MFETFVGRAFASSFWIIWLLIIISHSYNSVNKQKWKLHGIKVNKTWRFRVANVNKNHTLYIDGQRWLNMYWLVWLVDNPTGRIRSKTTHRLPDSARWPGSVPELYIYNSQSNAKSVKTQNKVARDHHQSMTWYWKKIELNHPHESFVATYCDPAISIIEIWNLSVFHELLSNGPFQQRLQRVATNKENDRSCRHIVILIRTLLEIQIFFSAVYNILESLRPWGPGFSVVSPHIYIYIHRRGAHWLHKCGAIIFV